MADIPALERLQTQLEKLMKIKTLEDVDDIDIYTEISKQTCKDAFDTLKQVNGYAEQIQTLVKQLAAEVKAATSAIQAKIKELFESLVVEHAGGTKVSRNINRLEKALKLQQVARDIFDQRLAELAAETEIALEKSMNAVDFTEEDIGKLIGCLNVLENREEISFNEKQEQEKLRQQREKEEEERRRKEEEERKRKEKEEEERRKKLEEEAKERRRKAKEEERKRKEKEEEERKKAEEERRRKEEEERKQREREEEERKKEEEKRKRKAEEERKRREREEEERRRKKLEEEEEERKRLQREKILTEKRRLDPDNWKPFRYTRQEEVDAVDGDTSHHKGVCCFITAPEGNIKQDDVTCDASDEVDDVIEILPSGNKAASSLINIVSTGGEIKTEVPIRVHVPHVPVPDPGDEIVFMCSVNGSDEWVTQHPVHTRKNVTTENIKTSCIELDGFESARLMAFARKKGETIVVDSTGKRHQLVQNKKMTLVMASGIYQKPTEIRVTVRPVSLTDPGNHVTTDVLYASPLTTLHCERPPSKSFDLEIYRSQTGTKRKGKLYHLYRTKDGQWNPAPTELKGTHVTLPPGKALYSYMELALPVHVPIGEVYKAAEGIFCMVSKTIVNVLVRQKTADPTVGILHIVRNDTLKQRIKELDDKGYDFGDACSTDFALEDGDQVSSRLVGNVKFPSEVVEPIILTFSALMDRARMHVKFTVKDMYIQKDLPTYMGRLVCEIVPRQNGGQTGDGLKVELPVNLPKGKTRPKSGISWVQVRFPHHLTALTTLLATRLTSGEGSDWFSVVRLLGPEGAIAKIQRRAKNKCEDGDDATICRIVLLDWMKEQPRHQDKVKPILDVLQQRRLYELINEVTTFVEYFRVALGDRAIRSVATCLTGSTEEIGKALGFTCSEVKEIAKPATSLPSEQLFMLLAEWRETDRAVKLGLKAAQEMKAILAKFM